MSKLSIIIPSRDERFLTPTIDDIFRNARGEDTEVIAVLDSDRWPGDWKEVTARHPRLHTVHNNHSIGLRGSINRGVASAISRGAKFIAKFDGHCAFSEGFDEILKADCDEDWIVVPRRGRLDPENWCETELQKPPIDYHYLSFPDDPNDFGGPGLNGKIWPERALARKDILIDDEMSSQGSGWFMHTAYFQRLELMDEVNYGGFWNEFQELGLKCWLSGGQVKVNKQCRYLHLHKGSKYGRGYRLSEGELQKGAGFTRQWIYNEAWDKQTKPFSWLIEHFWPVPTWLENWEEILYAERKPRAVGAGMENMVRVDGMAAGEAATMEADGQGSNLRIISARYGVLGSMPRFSEHSVDVADRMRSLVSNNSLDIVVNNATLCPNQNPFRGQKKVLLLTYSYGGDEVTVEREEKDWLIIGQVQERERDDPAVLEAKSRELTRQIRIGSGGREMERASNAAVAVVSRLASAESKRTLSTTAELNDLKEHAQKAASWIQFDKSPLEKPPMSLTALNDYLIRKFSISPQRLRGPMPIELRDFHRNDLAELFAELGFKRGAEIGVAEGKYSEVLLKANPECELLLVDPWHAYSNNPQNKSVEKNEYAYNETVRKTKDYPNVKLDMRLSMDAVRDVADNSLDFCYIDGHHSYSFVMADIIEWTKKVRSGGIVAGDDVYQLNEKWGAGPMEAIYDYTRAMRINPWFLINAHKSVDFFFVKS